MNRTLGWIVGAVALTCGASQAALLPYPEPQLKYPAYTYKDTELRNYWNGWLRRFVVGGVIQGNDPSGNKKPISEGQSYGMLLAVWMNDQKAFDEIWKATESKFWNASAGYYRWTESDGNFAGDADQDICAALIFASALADKKHWADNGYKAKAKTVLQSLDKNFFDGNGYVYSWPAQNSSLNPSYHMPAWHPIFKEFGDSNGVSIDWTKRSSAAFALINAQTNSASGMARNFSNSSGGPSGCGPCSSTPNINDMGFDAIRVPYRMGMAALWYPDKFPQAVSWCKSVWSNTVVDPTKPGMYKIDNNGNGTLWGWATGDEEYEKFLSRGMWGTAAIAVASKDAKSKDAFETIARDFSGMHASSGTGYLVGAEKDSVPTTSPAMNYYGQSLGLMGALVLFGRAWNVWDDLKHQWIVPDTAASFTAALTATPDSVEQMPASAATATARQTTKITATLSKSVPWTLRLKGRVSGATFSTSGTGTAISVEWFSLKRSTGTTKLFEAEPVDARLIYNGVDTVKNPKCKAVITVTKNSGVAPRPVRGNGLVHWTPEGLEIEDAIWQAGDRVQVKVLDLTGRTLQAANVELAAAKLGVRVSTKLESAPGIQVLELRTGAISRRYLLSPNP